MRRSLLLCVSLGALALGWYRWRGPSAGRGPALAQTPAPVIVKQPERFALRTFDPQAPPADMPPLPSGELAECDSNFQAEATVGGQTRALDGTHANLTVSEVKLTLELNVTIWVPNGATQHVLEHEQGHRQIAEFYYRDADKAAARIAAGYMGRKAVGAGTNLQAASSKLLEQMGAEITAEYIKELNSEPTQLLYDDITDHSRNDVAADDAVAQALRNIAVE